MTSARPLVTQRYTANTCTLEVTASPSPLSQWSRQPLMKQLRFQLWLGTAPNSRLLAAGNQSQLLDLIETVQTHLQQQLAQPAMQQDRSLTRRPLTQHRLVLAESTQTLSVLELFDLAEALDQYDQAAALLPALSPVAASPATSSRRRRQRLLWTGSVAAAFVVAVGVTATLRQQPELATQSAGDVFIEEDFGAVAESAPADAAELESDAVVPPETPIDAADLDAPASDRERPSTPPSTASPPANRPETNTAGRLSPQPDNQTETLPRRQNSAPPPTATVSEPAETNGATTDADSDRPAPAVTPAPQPSREPTEAPAEPPAVIFVPPDSSADESESSPSLEQAERGGASRGSTAAARVPLPETEAAAETGLGNVAAGSPIPMDTAVGVSDYVSTQLADAAIATPLIYQVTIDAEGRLIEVLPVNAAAAQYPIALPEAPIAPAQAVVAQVTVSPDGTVGVEASPAAP